MRPAQTHPENHKPLTQFLQELDLADIEIQRECDRGRDINLIEHFESQAADAEPPMTR